MNRTFQCFFRAGPLDAGEEASLHENYDDAYRNENYFGADESPLLRRFSHLFSPGDSVLDIGVGQGRNALPLVRAGCRVTGIDPSPVAIEAVRKSTAAEGLEIGLETVDFGRFEPLARFDFVLCFGLLQMIDATAGRCLLDRCAEWLEPGGVLFLTAWYRGDPAAARIAAEWQEIEPGCYRSPDSPVRTRRFLEMGAIVDCFPGWEILHHHEGLGPWHRHADGPRERHGDVNWVARRPAN